MMRVPKGSRWENRRVGVKDGNNVVLKCEYDGLGRGTPLTRTVMGVPGITHPERKMDGVKFIWL